MQMQLYAMFYEMMFALLETYVVPEISSVCLIKSDVISTYSVVIEDAWRLFGAQRLFIYVLLNDFEVWITF